MTEIRLAIVTVSDKAARGERADAGGPAIRETLQSLGVSISVVDYRVVADEEQLIAEATPKGIKKIVHLWNLRAAHGASDAQQTRRRGYESLVCLAQALAKQSFDAVLTIAVVSDQLWRLGSRILFPYLRRE